MSSAADPQAGGGAPAIYVPERLSFVLWPPPIEDRLLFAINRAMRLVDHDEIEMADAETARVCVRLIDQPSPLPRIERVSQSGLRFETCGKARPMTRKSGIFRPRQPRMKI